MKYEMLYGTGEIPLRFSSDNDEEFLLLFTKLMQLNVPVILSSGGDHNHNTYLMDNLELKSLITAVFDDNPDLNRSGGSFSL